MIGRLTTTGLLFFTFFLSGFWISASLASEGVLLPAVVGVKMREHSPSINKPDQASVHDLPALDEDLIAEEKLPGPPDDPCLPPLYKDWREFSLNYLDQHPEAKGSTFRIIIDRSTFRLTAECSRPDGSVDEVYESDVGLGDINSPTPAGQFVINHVYCYPDVMFFGWKNQRVPALYNGFFAPLLLCDEAGRCRRYRELGIHGFEPSARPDPRNIRPETSGAVSGGCIRLPDPCRLKYTLISMVGVGDLKKDDRGFYYWLKRPVEVLIVGEYPGGEEYFNVVSAFEKGLSHVQDGLRSFLDMFSPADNNN
jgi:hypothetical protein